MTAIKPVTQAQLDVYLKRIRDIPSLPDVVYKISEKLNRPGTAASEIAGLIAYDPGLTTRVLRMVNSASLGLQKQVSSVQHAIMLLGFANTRNLILSASILRMFEGSEEVQQQLWQHALKTGFASRVLHKFYEFQCDEDPFSAALLHDVGKMVLILLFKENYSDTLAEYPISGVTGYLRDQRLLKLEKDCFGITHPEVGAQLSVQWKLPASLTEVIQYHHMPDKATLEPAMVHWIAFANELVDLTEPPHELPEDGLLSVINPHVAQYFSLNEGLAQDIMTTLQAEMDNAEEWFSMFKK